MLLNELLVTDIHVYEYQTWPGKLLLPNVQQLLYGQVLIMLTPCYTEYRDAIVCDRLTVSANYDSPK